MAPTVTAKEKEKRRKQRVARRKQREKTGVGNSRPLPLRRAGRAFGKLLGAHAALIQLEAAGCSLSLTDGAKALLAGIDALDRQVHAPRKSKAIRLLRQYVRKRREMLDYPTALAHGWDIGSGPTEATCKTLTLRFERREMKWDRNHAADMMNPISLRESCQ